MNFNSYVVLMGGLNLRIGRTSDPAGVPLEEAKEAALAHLDHVFWPGGVPDPDYKPEIYSQILPRLQRGIQRLTPGDISDEDHEQSVDWVWPLPEYPRRYQIDRLPGTFRDRVTEEQKNRAR